MLIKLIKQWRMVNHAFKILWLTATAHIQYIPTKILVSESNWNPVSTRMLVQILKQK